MTEPSTQLEHQSPHGELRTAFYNPYDIKRRRRTSRSQFKTLEKAFSENPKPNASTRQQLAQRLSMTPRGIQVWFQNRRAKTKHISSTSSSRATHQVNPNNTSADDQPEDDIGPEDDPLLLVPGEPGPTEGESSNHPSSTLTVEALNALGEPWSTTNNKAQATRSDSVTSNYSSVLSVESLAVKEDTIHFQDSPESDRFAIASETWGRSQEWRSGGAHRPLATNLQPHPAPPAVVPFSPSFLSTLEQPTSSPQVFFNHPHFVPTPGVTREDFSPGMPQTLGMALDGQSSVSASDGSDQTEPMVALIEVQSKRRKSVSKHFRPSGGSPVGGTHVFDTSGGMIHGNSRSSFSESPTSVNAPSFTFSPPGQQPRMAGTQLFDNTTMTVNLLSASEGQGATDPGTRIACMGSVGMVRQSSLESNVSSLADPPMMTNNGGNAGTTISSSTQPRTQAFFIKAYPQD
ncbi:hypothetical protein BGX23_007475 [Mortierella sp. AD031]|nr:hypothetical protein BGX23_007475 [Mortierella sp. AD031]